MRSWSFSFAVRMYARNKLPKGAAQTIQKVFKSHDTNHHWLCKRKGIAVWRSKALTHQDDAHRKHAWYFTVILRISPCRYPFELSRFVADRYYHITFFMKCINYVLFTLFRNMERVAADVLNVKWKDYSYKRLKELTKRKLDVKQSACQREVTMYVHEDYFQA